MFFVTLACCSDTDERCEDGFSGVVCDLPHGRPEGRKAECIASVPTDETVGFELCELCESLMPFKAIARCLPL
jgi:hypothetical protein